MINTKTKILIVNLGGIGDILLSIPALKSLRNLYKQAEISMLVVPRVCEILENIFYFDKVYKIHIRNTGGMLFRKIAVNIKTLIELRRKKYDLLINMRPLVSERSAKKMKFILDFIHPKMKVGRDTECRGCFYDIKIPETLIAKKYDMGYYMDTLKAMGSDVIDSNISLEIKEKDEEKIRDILSRNGIKPNDVVIGIHPGGIPSRRWPVESFAVVLQKLYSKTHLIFVISGGEEEVKLTDKLAKLSNVKAINLAGRLSLNELSALIKRCGLYITNDTGPMHIAAVLKTPLIAIFGPGDITRYDPKNIYEKAIVLYKKAECAPCNKVDCKDLKCLNAISIEEVYEAALKMLCIG